MQSDIQPSSDPTVTATLLKSSPRSEAQQRDQVLRTAEIYSLRSSELGIDSILSAMARSLKVCHDIYNANFPLLFNLIAFTFKFFKM